VNDSSSYSFAPTATRKLHSNRRQLFAIFKFNPTVDYFLLTADSLIVPFSIERQTVTNGFHSHSFADSEKYFWGKMKRLVSSSIVALPIQTAKFGQSKLDVIDPLNAHWFASVT
jgi:hypothetical protein